jgi:AraC-like DNA-binding protein
MDALSEALATVRMTGAIFFNAEFSSPWGFAAPHANDLVPHLSPGTEHLVIYHLLTHGSAVARMAGMDDVRLAAGDIVIVPHGHPHQVSNGTPSIWIDSAKSLTASLDLVRYGGGGEVTRFVCGFFGCERNAGRLFLAGLPPLIKVNVRGDVSGEWLENSIRYLVSDANSGRPGRTVLLSKMAEALFIEALRRYAEELTPEHTGWLAAARDPVVGSALALIHRKPGHAWTLAELAEAVGASRSVLVERFNKLLGEPPLSYLARWRLQLAARMLQSSRRTMMQLALDVGYESEAAFCRAFKREFGVPPAQYRRRLSGNGETVRHSSA